MVRAARSREANTAIGWLLEGDPSIRWQTLRDLAGAGRASVERERARVATEGWGARLLALQDEDGTWGGGLYSPKWTSTTYTLLLLRALGLPPGNVCARKAALVLLDAGLYGDGGINLWAPRRKCSETCVTGMALAIGGAFVPEDCRLDRLALHLLENQMDDGGWNCRRPEGASHSSLHTTINVLEGLLEYESGGGGLAEDARRARRRAQEFLYEHRLFRSHRTGAVIDSRMTRFAFPPQWHYDVLRALDYLQVAGAERDSRVAGALDVLESRRADDGTWRLQNLHRGRYHFEIEHAGEPSRWNTLRALRVLKWWKTA